MLEERHLLAVQPFPVPLAPLAPGGSLIYQSATGASIDAPAEVESFTIDLDDGQTISVAFDGPSGSQWTLVRGSDRWILRGGAEDNATTTVRMGEDDAWRLLFNGLSSEQYARAVQIDGDPRLATPLLRARSVIV